ncbi:hypothetical protein ASNO1_03350 [Corallococcus caeni]|uniref:Uncharacterized protein n=1 Tax=Corallococcus caeni TaxID=3082388 RepID=A0ABQ6QJB7_9BACT|nr:hypothetical protein ASNO1_03350 [Corallococcus sp. NO1]
MDAQGEPRVDSPSAPHRTNLSDSRTGLKTRTTCRGREHPRPPSSESLSDSRTGWGHVEPEVDRTDDRGVGPPEFLVPARGVHSVGDVAIALQEPATHGAAR